MPFITTNDGVRIYYEEAGEGQPLLLIHGWSCSGKFFTRNINGLAQNYRVITMDLRGHGQSDKPTWGYRIARMAKDLKDLIEALELENIVLGGWSMGAAVMWSYIELFGQEHLDKLIIIDQSPRQYYTPDWKWGQGGCYDAEALAILSTRLEYDVEGVARGTVHACLTNEPTPEEEAFLVGEIMKCPGWIQAAIMTDHTNLDWRDLLPQINLPTMVLVGGRSKIFPPEGSAYVGQHMPQAITGYFDDSGHMLFFEEPEKFNKVVKDFIES